MVVAALYARISLDRHDGEGVARQLDDCRAVAAAQGWETAEYVDNDLSAYRAARRPSWERLLADLRTGRVGAVVAYHPDRLYRRLVDLEDLIDAIEAAEAIVATVKAGDIDLSTATGRMQARIIAAVARHESERMGERVSRAKQERAAQGRPSGGGRRAFGFTTDRLDLVPDEAAWIRRVADAVVAGATWADQAHEMRAAGVTTTSGHEWSGALLRRLVGLPLIAGYRSYKGQIVGDTVTPPVIDRDTWNQIRLTTAARKRGRPPSDRFLLTGLIRCGRCQGRMFGAVSARRSPTYKCVNISLHTSTMCGTSITLEPLEALVESTVLGWLGDPELEADYARHVNAKPAASPADDAEADQLERRRAVNATRWGLGELTDSEYEAARDAIAGRLATIDATRTGTPRLRIAGTELRAIGAAWPELTITERRLVLAEVLVVPIVIGPGGPPDARVPLAERVDLRPVWARPPQ